MTWLKSSLIFAQPGQVENEERLTRDRFPSRIDKQHLKSVRLLDEESLSASESTMNKTLSPRSALQSGPVLSATSPATAAKHNVDSTDSVTESLTPSALKVETPTDSTDSVKVVTAYTAPFTYTPNTAPSSTPQSAPPSRPAVSRVTSTPVHDSLRAPLLSESEDLRYNALERGQAWSTVGMQHKHVEPECCASCNIL